MSSMTDIIFLLLIFFIIVSSVVKEPSLRVVLPKGVKHNVVNDVIRIFIDENRNYAIDEQKNINYSRLPQAMQMALKSKPGATISINADKNLKYDYVMQVVMMADKMNAKVVLALKPEG